MREIIAELRANPTVSVPVAGKALGDLSRNVAYAAAKRGELGVPTIRVGGKIRVPSVAVLRAIGLADSAA
jgi:hypothetical protein